VVTPIYSGHLRAQWIPAERRWHVYGPGNILYGRLAGSREQVLSEMRAVNGFPTTCRRTRRPLFPTQTAAAGTA
jgi:hypothetical protein